ncbi:dihydroorotase [Mucilaginibacter pallidiroseus]|uniref:Dihydroorotase n=1 Tax=Mucilaginibacter pallidiroseus TaxID=2599295 RepID=A0A563UIG3_9SPHI|nr:dihydroorotase [Mucilaginibacter pallidiroseus]TWR31157.1 dihydroorotase [Mucilaginibacter pallidiroseus]
MNLLIKSATVIDPASTFNKQVTDILIENGTITKIASSISNDDIETYDATGKYVSPGFFDLNCNIGELGLETKEDLETGSAAAAAGGFTGVALMPNTQPPVHSKAEVEYLRNRAKNNLVDIYPLGTISHNREGKDMAEMYDMFKSGALAFTDGTRPVQDAGLMERAMLYVQGFGAQVISYPEDTSIAGKAKVNEGVVSTMLGMKGIPSLAEELMLARDLYLAEYTGASVHFTTISTKRSVELIRDAKAKGLNITCDVAINNLVLTDEALMGFDSQYKVKPPLRTQDDVDALLAGLKDGTIDAIVTQHTPHEIEFKDVEFEVAAYGTIGLQTAFALALKAGLDIDTVAQKMAVAPRAILNVSAASIKEGSAANLVLLDTEGEWEYARAVNQSKSYNSPFMGQNLKGKVLLTCNNNQTIIF